MWDYFREQVESQMEDSSRNSRRIRFYYPFLQWWEGENPERDNITISEFFWDSENGAILTVASIAEHVCVFIFLPEVELKSGPQIIWQFSGPTVPVRDSVYKYLPRIYEAERALLAAIINRRQALFLLNFVQDSLLAIRDVTQCSDTPAAMRSIVRAEKIKAFGALFNSMSAELYDTGELAHMLIASPEEFVKKMF